MRVVGIFIAVCALVFGLSYMNYANEGNRLEVLLKMTQEDNKNVLSQYGQKLAEMSQVPDMYRDDVVKVVKEAIQGRYGEKGSNAVIQMLREDNPKLDSSVYVHIQQAIEAGRNDFTVAQRKMLDVRRIYETKLGSVWSGFWLKLAGYPRVTLADYDIVSTERVNSVFKTKIEAPIKLR